MWMLAGPQGAAGAQGVPGPQGAAGPQGAGIVPARTQALQLWWWLWPAWLCVLQDGEEAVRVGDCLGVLLFEVAQVDDEGAEGALEALGKWP